MNKYEYTLKGLECANCANKIEIAISKLDNYKDVIVNFNTSKLVFYSGNKNNLDEISKIINAIEPDIVVTNTNSSNEFVVDKSRVIRLIIGFILGIASLFFNDSLIKTIVLVLAIIVLLPKTLIKAIKVLVNNKSLDENILISISVIGALLINDGFEGFMVIFLYEIGKTLENIAVVKSKRNVQDLMNIKPEYANLKINGDIVVKEPEEVKIDDIILIKVGERIPLDGVVIKGESYLNTSALTGESKMRDVKVGDEVLSGSINVESVLEIKVTKEYKNSTVSRILDLVENATSRKARTENFVSRAARVYTPIIILLAILTAILFPLLTDLSINDAIYRALSFLVISCPCAIAISVPLSYFAGIGKSSSHGILIKGSDYLDNLRKVSTICFDKTGTLTTGEFSIKEIISLDDKYESNQLLKIVATGESFSNHPIAKSIVNYYKSKLDSKKVTNYKEIAGIGISFNYEELKVKVGALESNVLAININERLVGKIVLEDKLKNNVKKVINILTKLGIDIYIFTGDNKTIALNVAKEINIENIKYEMLPEDKYKELEILLKNKGKNEVIAYVGDGINDAPVLTLSDIGISMGSIGSAAAIEASDVVIVSDDVSKILEVISISKITANVIKQNLVFALGIKLTFIVLNLIGFSTMSLAVFADVGVTVLCILNSIRILKMKIK